MQQHLAAGEADLIAAASLAFLASSTLPRGLDGSYSSDDEVSLALPQPKQGFERANCAERIDYSTITKHLLEAEECQRASQRYRSTSWSTGAPSSMHASADRFDATNGSSDAGNHGSDDTITGAHAAAHGEEQRAGDVHGVGVAGSTDEPRGSGGSDGTARPPSSDDAPEIVKEEDVGAPVDAPPCAVKVTANEQELRTLRMELLQGLALHVKGSFVAGMGHVCVYHHCTSLYRAACPRCRAALAGAAVLVATAQRVARDAP